MYLVISPHSKNAPVLVNKIPAPRCPEYSRVSYHDFLFTSISGDRRSFKSRERSESSSWVLTWMPMELSSPKTTGPEYVCVCVWRGMGSDGQGRAGKLGNGNKNVSLHPMERAQGLDKK
jgi:hypothetical protein